MELARFFVEAVLPCEGGFKDDLVTPEWDYGFGNESGFLSRAQFHPDTWERSGHGDPLDPYTVGANTATWIGLIGVENIATNAGWPYCGRGF